jgi:hypothetical protein
MKKQVFILCLLIVSLKESICALSNKQVKEYLRDSYRQRLKELPDDEITDPYLPKFVYSKRFIKTIERNIEDIIKKLEREKKVGVGGVATRTECREVLRRVFQLFDYYGIDPDDQMLDLIIREELDPKGRNRIFKKHILDFYVDMFKSFLPLLDQEQLRRFQLNKQKKNQHNKPNDEL